MPATTILALHGFTGRGSDFDALAASLPACRFIAPDLPGHGPAPGLPASLAAHLEVVGAALKKIDGPPVLLGYSMGGRVALHAALAFPEKFSALILIGASPGIAGASERAARRKADATLAIHIRNIGTAAFLREWDVTPLLAGRDRMPEPWKSRSLAARLENTTEGLATSLTGVGTGVLEPQWERLSEIVMPTLLLAGERDAKFTALANLMAETMPGADVATIEGAGHAAHMEAPDKTAGIIRTFLGLE